MPRPRPCPTTPDVRALSVKSMTDAGRFFGRLWRYQFSQRDETVLETSPQPGERGRRQVVGVSEPHCDVSQAANTLASVVNNVVSAACSAASKPATLVESWTAFSSAGTNLTSALAAAFTLARAEDSAAMNSASSLPVSLSMEIRSFWATDRLPATRAFVDRGLEGGTLLGDDGLLELAEAAPGVRASGRLRLVVRLAMRPL